MIAVIRASMATLLVVVVCLAPGGRAQVPLPLSPANAELFAAVRRAWPSDVGRAIERGASPDAVDQDGTPALMLATLVADVPTMNALLARGANPNQQDASKATALMWAVPDLAKVQVLLRRGADVNARSDLERTPLLIAAAYPRTVPVLQVLLDAGADVRAQDRTGATALALAVRSAAIDVVRFLVERGLDPKDLSPGARRAAFARHDRATTDFLMARGLPPPRDLLLTTAVWQPADLIGKVLDAGADVNATDSSRYGRTPLMSAVASEDEGADALKLLLERGANPNARTTEGESPLDWAIYKGDKAKIAVLEQHGAMRGDGPRRQEIPPSARGGITDPRVSIGRGMARVLEAASRFRDQATCISCHHNAVPGIAAAAARRKGIEVDAARERKNLDDMLQFYKSATARMMQSEPAVGGEALTTGYVQMALAADQHRPDKTTAVMTHWLLARQMPDGSWLGNGVNRPPSEYSTISQTAIAAAGLAAFPLAARAGETAGATRKAREWLVAARATSAEERAMRLMGLVWTGAPRAAIADATRDVRAQQDPRGGWSQFSRTDPDAYATGLSLYALHTAGVPATDKAYRDGVAFLLGSQYQDGTWLVRTHSFPIQRYFESSFPYGRHQWISAAGTSWASLAIAQTLPDTRR